MRVISPVLALALIAASLVLSSTPVYAMHGSLSGTKNKSFVKKLSYRKIIVVNTIYPKY